ncbi:hypothetical protein BJV77DRAFT_728899 [Russula vinacea]|nr:hypothetical protein BJV77DRAFT_728899 [Russula vinacea]
MRGPLRCHSAVGIPVYLPVVYSLLYRLLGGHMVNFKSPVVAEQDFNVVLKHLWHTTHGIFIWEYITTLGYELDVIRGRRPYRWTIFVYSLARAATFVAVILNLVQFNILTPIKCQTWTTLELIFSYMGLVAASLLIVFRIVAIWNKNRLVIWVTTVVWLINVGVIIQGIVRIRSAWNPLVQSCVVLNSEDNKANIIVTFISDVILLVIMLVGLLILRRESGIVFPLGSLLWSQGIIWLAIATAAEVPPSVFIILDLNGIAIFFLQWDIGLNPIINIRFVEPHVPVSLVGCDVNCCDTDVSLSI